MMRGLNLAPKTLLDHMPMNAAICLSIFQPIFMTAKQVPYSFAGILGFKMRFLLCFEAEEVAKSQILMKRTGGTIVWTNI